MSSEREKNSGSIASNRLDYQIDQALVFAIKLFDEEDFLIVMDYEDDLVIYNDEQGSNVKFYQIKTNEDTLSVRQGISDKWFSKLYSHITDKEQSITPHSNIEELGLITNCSLHTANGKYIHFEKASFNSALDDETLSKVKDGIANQLGVDVKDIDLKLFTYRKSDLSIKRHVQESQQILTEFLDARYCNSSLKIVKSLHSTLRAIIREKQDREKREEAYDFERVKQKKTLRRSLFKSVIEEAIMVSLPSISELERQIPRSMGDAWKVAYCQLTRDVEQNSNCLHEVAKLARQALLKYENETGSMWKISTLVADDLKSDVVASRWIGESADYYLELLALSIVYNKSILKNEITPD